MNSILKILNPSLKLVFTSHNLNIGSKFREFIVFLLKPFRDIDDYFLADLPRIKATTPLRTRKKAIKVRIVKGSLRINQPKNMAVTGVTRAVVEAMTGETRVTTH